VTQHGKNVKKILLQSANKQQATEAKLKKWQDPLCDHSMDRFMQYCINGFSNPSKMKQINYAETLAFGTGLGILFRGFRWLPMVLLLTTDPLGFLWFTKIVSSLDISDSDSIRLLPCVVSVKSRNTNTMKNLFTMELALKKKHQV
jgi:hypothetical protein